MDENAKPCKSRYDCKGELTSLPKRRGNIYLQNSSTLNPIIRV